MTLIATAYAVSTAPVQAFFDRWADVASWPDWNTDTDWVRLDGEFCEGASGRLKPKGGPTVRFVITELEPGRVFTDVSRLPGARLMFRHVITDLEDGAVRVDVTVSMTGPFSRLWRLAMGKGLRTSLPRDLAGLVAAVQQDGKRADAESA